MYSGPRFRIIVAILIVLILWQFFRLVRKNEIANDIKGGNYETLRQNEVAEGGAANAEAVEKDSKPKRIFQIVVYYEALCPDSRHFFLHHLWPVQEQMSEYVKINLIPYGKAKTIENSKGKLEFKCQHGPDECYANKIHACALNKFSNDIDLLKFITCMITDNLDPDEALRKCGEIHVVNIGAIRKCANEEEGSALLKQHGEATDPIEPYFIPTVAVDGDRGNLPNYLKNFKLELCKLFTAEEKPEAICS